MVSDEQKKIAQTNLEQAVRDYLEAVGKTDDGVMVDYLLVTQQSGYDEEGDVEQGLVWTTRRHQPLYRTMGLLSVVNIRYNAMVAGNLDASHH